MAVKNNLTEQEILELKSSIGSLESSILKIYSNREPRDLLGDEGILIRTLGFNFKSPNRYEAKYFDKRREKKVDTEFSEVIEALGIYDRQKTSQNETELFLEVGDILFQREVLNLFHKNNNDYDNVIKQFNMVLDYISDELGKRNLSFDEAKRLVKIKYGSRAWLISKGYNPKDKDLERRLCMEL